MILRPGRIAAGRKMEWWAEISLPYSLPSRSPEQLLQARARPEASGPLERRHAGSFLKGHTTGGVLQRMRS